MKETKLKAFEFATDLTKQLITLSTILIGLSITFLEKFNVGISRTIIILSWSLLFVSIIFGIFTLMALTGNIGKINSERDMNTNNIYSKNITSLSILQIFTFIVGILLLIIYSACSTNLKSEYPEDKEEVIINDENFNVDSLPNDSLHIFNQ